MPMISLGAGVYRAGLLNGAAIKKELLGQCGLAGVRMADDAKGSAFVDFYFVINHDEWGLASFTVLSSLY
jgi:hypothetical protein